MARGRGRLKGCVKSGGKKVGSKNQKTLEWEEFGRTLVGAKNLKRAVKIMEDSDPTLFMKYFANLLEYFKPKLNRTEITGKDGQEFFKAFNGIDTDKV